MNDAVNLAMRRAVRRFGSRVGIFNASSFAHTLQDIAGVKHLVDGEMVAAVLCGRSDVRRLSGGSHYQLIELEPPIETDANSPTH